MRKIIIVAFFVFAAFVVEFFIFNLLGRWGLPNLLLLLVIFFNLLWGIRFSIYAALWAGVLRDSFSTDIFGLNICALVFCAYMTTIIQKYFYLSATRSSRLLLAASVTFIHVLIQYCLHAMFYSVDFFAMVKSIVLPEMVLTILAATHVFQKLRQCVSKLSV